ncbi:MAG: SurA N-terminal domain-containing protein [Bacteroidales bacterium]|nr:SurA N-terminal domain-containing protein [Bacteroidales bacterium]
MGVFISVVIAIALLSFIIDPNTLASVSSSMSKKNDVGEINGKSISYMDFQSDVETFTTVHQIITGSTAQNEQQQTQIRNAAWQSLVDKYLFIENAKAAGIKVGNAELVELTSGNMLSPVVANDPIFADENGAFSASKLLDLVNAASAEGGEQAKAYWNYIQNTVRTQQFYAKYGSLFAQSNFVTPLQKSNAVEANNVTSNVEFVMLPYNYAKDTTITVSSKEIKNYYKAHKDNYKQTASRDIEYVMFEVVPSEADVTAANEAIAAVYDEFVATDNMKSFLLKNSERSLSSYWYKAGELKTISEDVENFVANAKAGQVSEVINTDDTFYAVKVLDVKKIADDMNVRYYPLADGELTDEALAELRKAEPMQMTQSYIIPGFEVLFTAKPNTPEVIATQYGKFAAEVVSFGEAVEKKQVAILEKSSIPSKETFNTYYSKANTLATAAAGSYENYTKAVAEQGLVSQPLTRMAEGTNTIGGVDNAREISRWAFDNKVGNVSNIITVNNNYFYVVALTGIHKEGYAPINEVAAGINSTLYAEKRNAKKVAEVAEKIEGLDNLAAVAEALETTVSTKEGLSFASAQSFDPKFAGAVAGAEEGALVGPVEGSMGVYVFTVNARETGSFFTEEDAETRFAQIAQYSSQMVVPVMMQDADVKDNRARFF